MLGRTVCSLLTSHEVRAPARGDLDLLDAQAVRQWFAIHRPRVVIHLAGYVRGLAANIGDQVAGLNQNARMALNIVEACAAYPPARLVVAGSTAAYGYPYPHLPLREDDLLTGDVHAGEYGYAWGQRTLIAGTTALRRECGVDATVAVLTNLFGPDDRFHGDAAHSVPALIARFVAAADTSTKDVHAWGSPDTTRDFMFAADAASAIVALVDTSGAPLLVNVASGEEHTMGHVVQTIATASGFDGTIIWNDSMPVGIPRRSVDISRLSALVAMDLVSFEEGVRQTVAWYRANRQRAR